MDYTYEDFIYEFNVGKVSNINCKDIEEYMSKQKGTKNKIDKTLHTLFSFKEK